MAGQEKKSAKEIIQSYKGPKIRIMEVCGTHTHEIFRLGIRNLLPPNIELISGPGCPVCVTPVGFIDEAVYLALEKGATICTFGDLVRVPGTEMSLAGALAEIRKVELIARGAEVDGQAPVAPDDLRRYLDDRLQTLRRELIEDICEGRIKGDQVLTNILALLNDTRAGLRRESVSTAAEDGHPDVQLRRVA